MRGWKNPYLLKNCLNSYLCRALGKSEGVREEALSKQRRIRQLSSLALQEHESGQITVIKRLMRDGQRELSVAFRHGSSFTDTKQHEM